MCGGGGRRVCTSFLYIILHVQLTKLINEAIEIKTLEYLLKLRGSKGSEIEYKEIKMADYLMPNEENLTISDKRYIFAIRNRMIQIPNNFPTKNKKTRKKIVIYAGKRK